MVAKWQSLWSRRVLLQRGLALVSVLIGGRIVWRVLFPPHVGPRERDTLATVLDTLIPDGDFPGARRTGVLERLVAECETTPQTRRALVEGTAFVEAAARQRGARSFAALTDAARGAILAECAVAENASLPWFFFRTVRDRAMRLHYAHPLARRAVDWIGRPSPWGTPTTGERRMSDADVVVVGAGAGGLAAAWRLATQGVRVTLIEAGRQYLPSHDYPQTTADFELQDFPYDPERDATGKARYGFGQAQDIGPEWDRYRSHNRVFGRYVAGNRRHFARYEHVRGVGGSTLHFQGEAHRYHPHALDMHARFGSGDDWPLPYGELERYYDLVEERVGVAAPTENEWRPRTTAPTFPPHRLSYASQRLAPAFAAIGAPLLPNALAILPQAYDGRPPCNYCNSCTQGCPLGDKGSADAVWLPSAQATGRLVLVTQAQVLQIEVDARGRAAGVVCRKADGSHMRTRGRAVVLAGGAIETPRLLLLSAGAGFPDGLANRNGQVGRHLTEHLSWSAVALLSERVDAHRGQPIDGTAWRFAVPSASPRGYVGGFRLSTAHGALDLRGPAAYAERLVDGFGRAHQERIAAQFGHAVGLLAMGDWLPNDATYVDLDPALRDEAGLPVARLHSHLGENERQLLRHMADTTRALVAAVPGAEIVEETSALDLCAPAHVLGTCRMGSDPLASVADADGISHDVPNLAFADGSLLPSSGNGDSPSLTIMALALRTADRLIAHSD